HRRLLAAAAPACGEASRGIASKKRKLRRPLSCLRKRSSMPACLRWQHAGRSEGEQNGRVPGIAIRLVCIPDPAPDVSKQMEILVQVVTPADPHAARLGSAAGSRGLMENLRADLKPGKDLIGEDRTCLAKIRRVDLVYDASAASEGGPSAIPVLFHPYRQQQ